jgi:hypothetical protein
MRNCDTQPASYVSSAPLLRSDPGAYTHDWLEEVSAFDRFGFAGGM